jgi:photosystem II stability/assembly factor-like uncharacterized protein
MPLNLKICLIFIIIIIIIMPGGVTRGQSPRFGGQMRLEAWREHQTMAESSPFRELEWQAMGPKFAGGRIESVVAPRGDLGTLYAGVGAGGVWKTTNGGLTWKPIFHRESTFSIGDVAVSQSNPNILWVGTGECHLSRSSYPGNGVFKSTDAGKTWTNLGLHESAHIGSVVIHPTNPDIVYIAAMGRKNGEGERGIYRTVDGGQTFEQVLNEGPDVSFVDLVIDPNDFDTLFASAWDRSGGNMSGVFRSDDGGTNWMRLGGGLLDQKVDRVAVDVATNQPGVVYALMADGSSPELAKRRNASILFRSEDSGETWTRTHEGYVPTYIGWDFCDLRVAPDDANRVYVGGTRLIISYDGGKTFEGEGGFAVNKRRDEVFRLHPTRGIGMHLDVHDIWIDPEHPERMTLGNDGGLYISNDRGRTWLHLNTLPIAEFYQIRLDDQQPFHIWGGTQDNASFEGPVTARLEDGVDDRWQQVFLDPWTGGDGFSTFPDPNDPQTTYYTQQMGDLRRSRLGRLKPERGIHPKASEGESELRFSWDTPFFASSHPGKTVLYCGAQRVLRSDDRGDSWRPISPDLVDRDALLALAESPVDSLRLVAGAGQGKIFLTTDGGEHWCPAGSGLPRAVVRDVVPSAHDANLVYVVLSGKENSDSASYVFRSNDFGETWESIASNLPSESCNALAEDPKTKDLIFVGTDLGVYASIDGGREWHSLCDTLPTASVMDLQVHGRDGILVAATHGLSIFSLDIKPIRDSAAEPGSERSNR